MGKGYIITRTCLCNFDPLKPHFYIVKLGFTGVHIIFLNSAQNIDCGYSLKLPHWDSSNEYPQSIFWAEIWEISKFLLENFHFLVVKFSVYMYLNRHVFVMLVFCVCSVISFFPHPPSSFPASAIKGWCVKQEVEIFYEPEHEKTYNKTCATSEDSDQPAHPCNLIRVFADGMCLLQPPGHPMKDKQEPLPYWVDVQPDLSLCWSHRSYCRFCRMLAHMS